MMPIDVQQSASSVRMWLEMRIVLPIRAQFFEQRLHFQPGPRVEAAGGFVEDQHGRIVDQRLGQAEPLLHAAREAVDEVVALVRQVEQLQHVADDRLAAAARESGRRRRRSPETPRPSCRRTRRSCRACSRRSCGRRSGRCVTLWPLTMPSPAVALQQRGQKADRGALAGAVGADEAEHLAGVDLEIQVLRRRRIRRRPS